jgi:hypothetical protein
VYFVHAKKLSVSFVRFRVRPSVGDCRHQVVAPHFLKALPAPPCRFYLTDQNWPLALQGVLRFLEDASSMLEAWHSSLSIALVLLPRGFVDICGRSTQQMNKDNGTTKEEWVASVGTLYLQLSWLSFTNKFFLLSFHHSATAHSIFLCRLRV